MANRASLGKSMRPLATPSISRSGTSLGAFVYLNHETRDGLDAERLSVENTRRRLPRIVSPDSHLRPVYPSRPSGGRPGLIAGGRHRPDLGPDLNAGVGDRIEKRQTLCGRQCRQLVSPRGNGKLPDRSGRDRFIDSSHLRAVTSQLTDELAQSDAHSKNCAQVHPRESGGSESSLYCV